jgi:cytochrome c553
LQYSPRQRIEAIRPASGFSFRSDCYTFSASKIIDDKTMKTKPAKIIILLLAACAFTVAAQVERALISVPASASTRVSTQISFDRDIRPLFAERCLACHGEKKQSGGLRLDSKAFAMRGGRSGPAIAPGKALESRIYQRVAAANDDERMPPAGERLSAAQIAMFKSWIDAGAVWPEGDDATGRQDDRTTERSEHWAWQPIKRPPAPAAPEIRNFRNPVTEAEKIDSGNALLWRQNRRKLEAEAVRDAVLAVSGKLDLTMGGPGWQDFVIERPEHSPHYEYGLADPEDARTWRRSIYRFIVPSQTQPWMTALDCADPSMRVDKRNESISPLPENTGCRICAGCC